MTLGLISDTHGFLDPQIPALFQGVDHILHAGDIGSGRILMDLECIAPVTAVMGNNDYGIAGLDCRETEVVELGGVRILVHHIVTPESPLSSIGGRFASAQPRLVMFGHTHAIYDAELAGVRFVNPGYSGKPRFSLERSVARMTLDQGKIDIRFYRLER